MPRDLRLESQAELILTNLTGAEAHPSSWQDDGEVNYFYQRGTLLVAHEDRQRVSDALRDYLGSRPIQPDGQSQSGGQGGQGDQPAGDYPPGGEQNAEPTIEISPAGGGLSKITFTHPLTDSPDQQDRESVQVPAVLDALDPIVGIGTARPDTVLFVANAHPCPATEPEEVWAGTVDPFPAVRPQSSCCHHGSASTGGQNVHVTVGDLGWLPQAAVQHPWMAGIEGDEEDPFDATGSFIRPYVGHGTFVAGVVRAMAPRCVVRVERIVEEEPEILNKPLSPALYNITEAENSPGGNPFPRGGPLWDRLLAGAEFESNMVKKVYRALLSNPDILVLEFVAPTRYNLGLFTMEKLYDNELRHRKGLVVVVPAGNEGRHDAVWPAAFPWTVSVGALSANGRTRADFSNYGGWVDVYAPGEDLVNAYATGDYKCNEDPNVGVVRKFQGLAKWSGTSFSTPLVAGLIAARMSDTGENGQQAAQALLEFARSQAIPGVGAVLYPGQSNAPESGDSTGSGRD